MARGRKRLSTANKNKEASFMKAPKKEAPNNSNRKAAAVIGRSYLRAQLVSANPDLKADKLRTEVSEKWSTGRQAYIRLGNSVIRNLERAGYALTPVPGAAPRAPAKRQP
jgi:hypothetical protein